MCVFLDPAQMTGRARRSRQSASGRRVESNPGRYGEKAIEAVEEAWGGGGVAEEPQRDAWHDDRCGARSGRLACADRIVVGAEFAFGTDEGTLREQESRNGGNGHHKPTTAEAEAAVLLAVPLVKMFSAGLFGYDEVMTELIDEPFDGRVRLHAHSISSIFTYCSGGRRTSSSRLARACPNSRPWTAGKSAEMGYLRGTVAGPCWYVAGSVDYAPSGGEDGA